MVGNLALLFLNGIANKTYLKKAIKYSTLLTPKFKKTKQFQWNFLTSSSAQLCYCCRSTEPTETVLKGLFWFCHWETENCHKLQLQMNETKRMKLLLILDSTVCLYPICQAGEFSHLFVYHYIVLCICVSVVGIFTMLIWCSIRNKVLSAFLQLFYYCNCNSS